MGRKRAAKERTKQHRLLLDQGFPKPPGFDVEQVDQNIEVEHLNNWAPDLSEFSTPDWVVYCEAALAQFDAVVTRDVSQTTISEEMYVLSRLTRLHLITFSHGIEDPISEWGQLLAYLPKIRDVMSTRGKRRVIVLPKPTLQVGRNLRDPREYLRQLEEDTRRSSVEIRHDAQRTIREFDEAQGNGGRYEELVIPKPRKRKARSEHSST